MISQGKYCFILGQSLGVPPAVLGGIMVWLGLLPSSLCLPFRPSAVVVDVLPLRLSPSSVSCGCGRSVSLFNRPSSVFVDAPSFFSCGYGRSVSVSVHPSSFSCGCGRPVFLSNGPSAVVVDAPSLRLSAHRSVSCGRGRTTLQPSL